jgi:hypothetical protein
MRSWFDRTIRALFRKEAPDAWKAAWRSAAEALDAHALTTLTAELDAMRLPEDEVEIEREMLDGLRRVVELAAAIDVSGLPVVETGHRAVGTETCHFSAPVSMPEEPGEPSGRLLLTGGRAIFVGGAGGVTIAWHAVGQAMHVDRDVVLIRADRERLYRFRCNGFGDALAAALLAGRLVAARRRPAAGL